MLSSPAGGLGRQLTLCSVLTGPSLLSLPPTCTGIGGSYMCIYPMDSPGGYQLVGRTLPIWNTFGRSGPFSADKPWLLEFFDQVGITVCVHSRGCR
jgi:allophanate hydrolase subunit 1